MRFDVLTHVSIHATDLAQRTLTVSPFGSFVDVESGLRTKQAPMVGRGKDGTAVRDYTHVVDLAEAHVLALGHLQDGGASAALNLGTGTGYSVLQVVKGLEQVAGRPLPVTFGERRPGDPPVVWADPARASEVLGWRARFGLVEILPTAWQWHARSHLVG